MYVHGKQAAALKPSQLLPCLLSTHTRLPEEYSHPKRKSLVIDEKIFQVFSLNKLHHEGPVVFWDKGCIECFDLFFFFL